MAAASSWGARTFCRSASRPARSTTMCRSAISGSRRNHAMYFEDERGVLIEAKDLVNGVSIVQAETRREGRVLPHRARNPRCDHRRGRAVGKLHRRRQPRHVPQRARIPDALSGCGDRARALLRAAAGRGYEVEAVRRRIALRAGLRRRRRSGRASARCAAMSIASARDCIAGWAQNVDHPEAPVCLDIYAGGRLIGQVLANRYREDLAASRPRQRPPQLRVRAAGRARLHDRRRRGASLARRCAVDADGECVPGGAACGGLGGRVQVVDAPSPNNALRRRMQRRLPQWVKTPTSRRPD